MGLRLTPTGDGGEAAEAMAKAKAAQDAADYALTRAENARGMVLADRERNAMSLDELRAAAAQLPTTQQAAAEAHLAFQQQIDMLRDLINSDATSNDETQAQVDALVQQVATISLTPGPSGKSAYELARDNGYGGTLTQWLASLRGADGQSVKGDPGLNGKSAYELAQVSGYGGTQAQWLASLKGADGQSIKGEKGDPGTPADMTRVTSTEAAITALQTSVTALNALKVRVGYGVANLPASLAAGATTNVTVTLSRDMGSQVYSVGYGLSGGTSLLGQLAAVGVTAQTATTVTIQVKNTGLTSLLNLSTATLSVVAARDA